eukprot:COSAG01_NODE_3570_length_5924_cov_4.911588_3_plen_94_part_00
MGNHTPVHPFRRLPAVIEVYVLPARVFVSERDHRVGCVADEAFVEALLGGGVFAGGRAVVALPAELQERCDRVRRVQLGRQLELRASLCLRDT